MLTAFTLRDLLDVLLMGLLLFYLYRMMRESGTINIFYGILAFLGVWVLASQILEMKLIGSVLDKFMSIGLLVLVIIFQDQIKRFLVELGDHKRWRFRETSSITATTTAKPETASMFCLSSMPA